MRATLTNEVALVTTPRVLQLSGIFDLPPSERSRQTWNVNLPIEEKPWNIGLIVAPSGGGKTTIARQMFGEHLKAGLDWPRDKSVLDAFPKAMPIREITELLNSVGFSSPPSWIRPFHALSNGEQFRVTVARTLAESPELAVIDEFTSVIDRQVAQIGSCAVAKTVRRHAKKLIALSCHYDVTEWLQPDWIYQPHLNKFQWRELQRRPPIRLTISRVHHSTWKIFARHHYLTSELAKHAVCFIAFYERQPVAFHSYVPFVGRLKYGRAKRGHRSVCLPDFQGVGIGNAMITYLAGMWKALGYRVFRNTGHPAEIAGARRSPEWKMTSAPNMTSATGGKLQKRFARTRSTTRLIASFEYIGGALALEEANRCLNTWATAC